MSWTQRSAGVLLHISSLPSRQLGADALRFMDVMAQAGLRAWQILPVGPATKHHNPFEPASAFAGDPALVPMGAGDGADEDSFEAFQREHADWLPDRALFSALEHELGDLRGGNGRHRCATASRPRSRPRASAWRRISSTPASHSSRSSAPGPGCAQRRMHAASASSGMSRCSSRTTPPRYGRTASCSR